LFDPAAAKSPPRIPNGSGGFKTFSGPTAVSDYNSDPFWQSPAGQALGGAPYVANPGVLLNTTVLGTDTIQSQDRRNVFASASHDLFDKRMQIYSDILYAGLDSEGKLAPAPVVGLGAKQANINIPADNPFNPFGIDLGPIGGTNGLPPNGPRIRSRFWESGNRLFDTQTDYYHFVGGLKGEFDNGWGYNGAYTYNRYDQLAPTRNAIDGSALDLALQPSLNPTYAALGLSQLTGTGATPVPIYNLFSVPGQNSPATLDAISTTLLATTRSVEWDVGAVITGAPLDLPAGKLGVAVGGGFTEESLAVGFDPLTRKGKVPGLNAAQPTSGTRRSWAGFAEIRIPVTSPEMSIPLLRSLEITAAGRYETFDPGGDSAVPKVALRWQPVDEQITLRMSYSQSFVAPATFQLFGGDSVSVVGIGVPVTSAPGAAISGLQEYTVNRGNPELKPVNAENWSGGIVLSPKALKGLTLSVDYYHVSTRNDVFRVAAQTMVDDLNAKGSASIWQPYFSKADGSQITSTAVNQANDADWGNLIVPLRNGAAVQTDGLDFTGNYQFDAGAAGTFSLYASANLLLSYDYADPFAGSFHYAGQYSDLITGDPGGQGTLADYQINTGLTWDFHDFSWTINARYVPPVEVASGRNFTINGKGWTVDSWYSVDMQLAYRFSEKYGKLLRGTRLAIGVNNITDNDPPLIASAFEDNTDKSTYDIVGRFIYFELSKKF
jgi:iron complex outermembrane receptor protein